MQVWSPGDIDLFSKTKQAIDVQLLQEVHYLAGELL